MQTFVLARGRLLHETCLRPMGRQQQIANLHKQWRQTVEVAFLEKICNIYTDKSDKV